MRVRDASVPYSLVAAVDEGRWQAVACGGGRLSRCAGGARAPRRSCSTSGRRASSPRAVGDSLTLEYYLWREEGPLETRSADFRVARIVPISGAAADRELVPDYPGITHEARLADWDPPFTVDLSRIRPQDEAYWQRYRTTPKAWLPLRGRPAALGTSAREHDVAAAHARRDAPRRRPTPRGGRQP